MATEQTIETNLRNYFAEWDEVNFTGLITNFVDDNFIRSENGKVKSTNQEEYIQFGGEHSGACAGIKISNVAVKNNKAYFQWSSSTPMKNECDGPNVVIENSGFSVWEFDEDGKAIREDTYYDELNLMQQLGHTLHPPE